MKLVEYSCSIGWKVHELAWSLHEIEFALLRSHPSKGVTWCEDMKSPCTPTISWFTWLEDNSSGGHTCPKPEVFIKSRLRSERWNQLLCNLRSHYMCKWVAIFISDTCQVEEPQGLTHTSKSRAFPPPLFKSWQSSEEAYPRSQLLVQ